MGTCGHCSAYLVSGEIEMEEHVILNNDEIDELGLRLTCVGTAASDEIQLVYNAKQSDYVQDNLV